MTTFLTHVLANGIRLVHHHTDSPVAHCGLMINTGSRDERPEQHGVAHLLEHMLFKGTQKRKAYQILSRMEDVGGEINAYTTKEETCIHSTFFAQYHERALELISDIALNSSFPEKEIQKEKEIIYDEINSYKDSPSELIFDEFEEQIFDGNPLGRNILGEEDKLRTFSRESIQTFIRQNYSTEQMVVASVGNIPFQKLIRLFEKYYNHYPFKNAGRRDAPEIPYQPSKRLIQRGTFQAHCIIGNIAYDFRNKKRLTLHLLNNYMGGPGLNSRLNLALREKRGYTYTIDSLYTTYCDTGNITIYFGTDKTTVDKCIHIILKELKVIKEKRMMDVSLGKAKKQLLGQIAISSENNENLMLSMAKSMLVFNKVDSLEEIGRKIDAITADEILEVANEIFEEQVLSYLIYN
ncbi:MAG: insulinase family protein [Bacteroidales bacterium]|nr:insulinase family protein [Bacteroidales bacterium]MBN2763207.1 insulinase family protein [Bacteroidales bacterium]